MVRNTVLLFLILLTAKTDLVFAQQISNQVLVPVAGVNSTGSVSYSQTIGESAVEIIKGSDLIFTEGFQQPRMTFLPGPPPAGNGVDVYPNPATDFIRIKLFGEGPRELKIELLNISGTIVYSDNLTYADKYYTEIEVTVSQLYKGIYFVRILSKDGIISRSFKIEKM
jgi:hypothetical protein